MHDATDDSATTQKVLCSRCGRTPRDDEPLIHNLPQDWEGPPPVCPGCQYAEWHPHCTSVRVEAGYGDRIDIDALERGESITVEIAGTPVVFSTMSDLRALQVGEIAYCDYVDLTISWTDDDEWPKTWKCPSCGGSKFEGVHRNYGGSGLKGTSFSVELEEVEDDDDDDDEA